MAKVKTYTINLSVEEKAKIKELLTRNRNPFKKEEIAAEPTNEVTEVENNEWSCN